MRVEEYFSFTFNEIFDYSWYIYHLYLLAKSNKWQQNYYKNV